MEAEEKHGTSAAAQPGQEEEVTLCLYMLAIAIAIFDYP